MTSSSMKLIWDDVSYVSTKHRFILKILSSVSLLSFDFSFLLGITLDYFYIYLLGLNPSTELKYAGDNFRCENGSSCVARVKLGDAFNVREIN